MAMNEQTQEVVKAQNFRGWAAVDALMEFIPLTAALAAIKALEAGEMASWAPEIQKAAAAELRVYLND